MMLGLGASYQKEKFQSKPSLFAQGKLADPVAGTLCDPQSADPHASATSDSATNPTTIPYSADRDVVRPVRRSRGCRSPRGWS